MKYLQELARFVTQNRLDQISSFATFYTQTDKPTKFSRFLDGIVNGSYNADEDAAGDIYSSTPSDVKYRVLKNRLSERLYNNVLLYQTGRRAVGNYTYVYSALYRQLVIAKLLITAGARKAGYALLAKVTQKAQKFQSFDIEIQCALHFRRYAMMQGNVKKFNHYNNIYKEAQVNFSAEVKAEELYCNLMIHFNESFANPKELITLAKNSVDQLSTLNKQFPTFSIAYYNSSVQTTYYYLIKNYAAAIEACNQYEYFLIKNKTFYTPQRHAVILSEKASYFLHMHDFDNGITNAKKALGLYNEGSINWFLLQELFFLLLLNKNDVSSATQNYVQVLTHSKFDSLRPQQQELWKIFGGYLWFMVRNTGNEECQNLLTSKKQIFRFSKLLNEVPHFSRDKKGMNVAVLILQVLILLQQKDYPAIISRTEALKSYMYRNLDKEAHRSHYFIKMLLMVEKTQFDAEIAELKTKKLLEKLLKSDVNYTATQARMEIIPYETLWRRVLSMLD